MRLLITSAILTLVIFFACNNIDKPNDVTGISQKPIDPQISKNVPLPFLDTVIVLNVLRDQPQSEINITNRQAKKTVYKYFKEKGILSRVDFKLSLDNANNNLCVSYDTSYIVSTSSFCGAVVSYWIGPPDLNGHCFQPSKAFIQYTNRGHRISNENFILTNFAIDSTVGSYIYGQDYDCGGRGIIRQFKILLK